jgi:hypothetical protein
MRQYLRLGSTAFASGILMLPSTFAGFEKLHLRVTNGIESTAPQLDRAALL